MVNILLCWYAGAAQECTDANVLSIPGKWKQGMKGASDQSAAHMAKEKALMEDLNQFIRAKIAWQPRGGDITYNCIYSTSGLDYRPRPVIKICNTYRTDLWFQHYFCGNGKINLEDFSIQLNVIFNNVPFTFSESFFVPTKDKDGNAVDEDPGTDKYAYVSSLPIVHDGQFDYTADEGNGSGNTPGWVYRYRTLTRPGTLPYVVITKKEFYEKWKANHRKAIESAETDKVKIAARSAGTGAGADIIKSIDQTIAVYRDWMDKIDAILKSKSDQELAMPALSGEGQGEYAVRAVTPERIRQYVVKPNLAYYNNKLPGNSPQVITISFRYLLTNNEQGIKHYADEVFFKAIMDSQLIDALTLQLQTAIME